ncbi:natterin-1-like [Erpetoichthys calabaricus]|uniref:natterin-1-like n=1 Tax=Erpetoichthys calabaricus TaxID=27687 RepID=UPI00109F946A|nr:natterin-1-like [Erpetoichthys calabaricus]
MARNIFDVLKETLDELREEEFKHFKAKLEDFKIARGKLEKADKCDTAILMTNAYNRNAMQIALQILEVVKRNDLVEKLKDEIRKSDVNERGKSEQAKKLIHVNLKTITLLSDCPFDGDEGKPPEYSESFYKDNINLKWVRWNGTLPQGAVGIYNSKKSRKDYVCKYRNHAGFYTPDKDSCCYYSLSGKEEWSNDFDILVNKDDFEPLEWKSDRWGNVPGNSIKTSDFGGVYVGKTSDYLGKVVPQHKNFFYPNEGKECYWPFYDVLVISQKSYTQQIVDINYETEQLKVVNQPRRILGSTTIDNRDGQLMFMSLRIQISFVVKKSWDIGRSTAAGVETQVTALVPHFSRNQMTLEAQKTFRCSRGTVLLEDTTHDINYSINMPARSKCTLKIEGAVMMANLPFTATLKRNYDSCLKQTSIEGIYKTANIEDLKAIVEEFEATGTV